MTRTQSGSKHELSNGRFHAKGQSILVSHAILVGFTVFLVYTIITTFSSIRGDYQRFTGGQEVKDLCFVMREAIDKAYNPGEYSYGTTNMGSIEVSLPDRIADIKYSATFFNKSILIRSDLYNDTCKVGYTANYNGSTSGGLTRFSYTHGATDVIEMVKL